MDVSPAILYKTLDSIPFFTDSFADAAAAEAEEVSYSVIRRRITSSPAPGLALPACEYLSLDVSGGKSIAEPLFGDQSTASLPSPPLAGPNGNQSFFSSGHNAWLRSGAKFRSPMLQLHQEILEFCKIVFPTQEEQTKRDNAVQSVTEVVKFIWPHCKVEVFGSFRTGLYLPISDIDVVLLESKVRTPQIGLYALAKALSKKGVAKKIQVIAKARVPIIKFVEKQSGVAFDISFDADGGPKAAEFIKDAINRIPPLRPLCLVLKAFLRQRELNEVFSGGIGSYTLLSMLIASLQIYWREQVLQRRHDPVERNLGILLVNFFDFYGHKLNTWEVGVSCNLKGSFFLKNEKGFLNHLRPALLSVEDPQAPENDIGKNSFNFYKVKSAFSMAYSSLTDSKSILDLGPRRSLLGTIIRPDPALLEGRRGVDIGDLGFDVWFPRPLELPPLSGSGDSLYSWQFVDDDEALPRGKNSDRVDDGSKRGQKISSAKEKGKSGRTERKKRKLGVKDKVEASGRKFKKAKK